MKKTILSILILLLLVLPGCGDSSISQVKDGILQIDKTAKVGNVLDNYPYFKSTSWSAFEDQSKRKIVEFVGVYDIFKALDVRHGINLGMDNQREAAVRICKADKKSVLYGDDMKLVVQFRIVDDKNFEIGYIGRTFRGEAFPLGVNNLQTIYRNEPPDHFIASVLCLNWMEDVKKYIWYGPIQDYVPSAELRKTLEDDPVAEKILMAMEERVKLFEQMATITNLPEAEYDTIINTTFPAEEIEKTLASFDQCGRYAQILNRLYTVQQNLPNPAVEVIISKLNEKAAWYETALETNSVTEEVFQERLNEHKQSSQYWLPRDKNIPRNQKDRYDEAHSRLWNVVDKIYHPKVDEILDEIDKNLTAIDGKGRLTSEAKQQARTYLLDIENHKYVNKDLYTGFNDSQKDRYHKIINRAKQINHQLMYR